VINFAVLSMDLLRQAYSSSSDQGDEEEEDDDHQEEQQPAPECLIKRTNEGDDETNPTTNKQDGRDVVSTVWNHNKRARVDDKQQCQQPQQTCNNDQPLLPSSATASLSLVRSVPHVRGNWAGHVFLPVQLWDSTAAQPAIRKSMQQFESLWLKTRQRRQLAPSSTTTMVHDDWHISLSRTFYLQLGSIESFVQDLRARVSFEHEFSLWLDMEQPEMLVNDEHTRSFWTLPVRKTSTTTPPWSTLLRLVQQVNDVLRKFQQPTYYESPIFHVSLASCVGSVVVGENKMMPNDDGDDHDDEQQKQQHRSTGTTTTTSSIQKKDGVSNTTSKEQIELSDDSDAEKNDDDDNDETPRFLRAHIDSIHCTFGTTKSYVIPLMKSS
jgi:hypothetical protein